MFWKEEHFAERFIMHRRIPVVVTAVAVMFGSLFVTAPLASAEGGNVIPDAGLQSCINKSIGAPATQDVSADLVAHLGNLTCNHFNIASVEGLQYLTTATSLDLWDNNITDLSPLRAAKALQSLDLISNSITDISPLPTLTALQSLDLSYNSIGDISPLTPLKQLTSLTLDRNHVSDLTPVKGLTKLTRLSVWMNSVTDVQPLAGLTSLTYLELSDNYIVNVSPLKGLVNLTDLFLGSNLVVDATPLASLNKLATLNLSSNRVINATGLHASSSLGLGSQWYPSAVIDGQTVPYPKILGPSGNPVNWYMESGTCNGNGSVITVKATGYLLPGEGWCSVRWYVNTAGGFSGTWSIADMAAMGKLTPGKPAISGAAKIGQVLTGSSGTWSPTAGAKMDWGYTTGTQNLALNYQWLRDGVPIVGATTSQYVLQQEDLGHQITFQVSGSLTGWLPDPLAVASAAVVPVAGALTPGVPAVTGTAAVGQTLSADAGSWRPWNTSFAYQWLRDGVAISGATAVTYKVQAADAGHKLSVQVTGSATGYTTASKTSAAVTVTATLPACPKFSDVASDNQFASQICWMAVNKITTGMPDGTYAPKGPVTREAMAAFMYRLAGVSYSASSKPSFPDVTQTGPNTNLFYTEIEWMNAKGITHGMDNGTYAPKQPVTREAMAAFLYRLAGSPSFTPPSKPTFSDVSNDKNSTAYNQFYTEIEWMNAKGITTGMADGTYAPKQPVTREAMAAFMWRMSNQHLYCTAYTNGTDC